MSLQASELGMIIHWDRLLVELYIVLGWIRDHVKRGCPLKCRIDLPAHNSVVCLKPGMTWILKRLEKKLITLLCTPRVGNEIFNRTPANANVAILVLVPFVLSVIISILRR